MNTPQPSATAPDLGFDTSLVFIAGEWRRAVGGQDELVFDGASFVMNAQGEVTTQLLQFEEAVVCVGSS